MKTLSTKLILLFSLLIITFGCEEDNYTESKLYKTQIIKDEFTLEDFDDVFVKNNLEVKWNDYEVSLDSITGKETFEFNTDLKVESTTSDYVVYKLIASKNTLDDWEFELIKFSGGREKINQDLSFFNLQSFSGSLHYYTLKGKNTLLEVYEDGKLKNELIIDDFTEKYVAPNMGNHCSGCHLLVKTDHYIDWYNIGSGGVFYTSSTYSGSTYEWVWIDGGMGGDYNGMPYDNDTDSYHNHLPHGPNPTNPNNHYEEIILENSFKNNDCLNNVFQKFEQGDNTISQYIENFVPQGSVANLNLKTDNNFQSNYSSEYWGAGAITSEPDNFMITITFNTDPNLPSSVSNYSSLVLGVEFMHEMVHAEMYRKLLSHAQQPNIPWTRPFINSLRNDFEGLADYYTRYWLELPPEQEPTSAQHQLMAEHYVDIMTDALADFDDNQNGIDYYESLSWLGLKETVAWDNLSPSDTLSINNNIQNALQDEPCN